MPTILKAADLKPAEFAELVGNLKVPEQERDRLRVWMEAPDGWALARWPGSEGTISWCGAGRLPQGVSAGACLAKAVTGRFFAPSGELKWRMIRSLGSACCRVVFLGSSDWPGDRLQPRRELESLPPPRRESYILWGQQTPQTPGEWVELRIPHRFQYPVEVAAPLTQKQRGGVRVQVEIWSDHQGEPHFVRLYDLEPYLLEEGK